MDETPQAETPLAGDWSSRLSVSSLEFPKGRAGKSVCSNAKNNVRQERRDEFYRKTSEKVPSDETMQNCTHTIEKLIDIISDITDMPYTLQDINEAGKFADTHAIIDNQKIKQRLNINYHYWMTNE